MRKIYALIALFLFVNVGNAKPCGGGWSDDYMYYNLFMQEIIDNPDYYPFLLTMEAGFYNTDKLFTSQNENIEQWQEYLGIDYSTTQELVFKISEAELNSILLTKKTLNSKLAPLDSKFITKNKKALEYLVLSKKIEPYMAITHSKPENSWSYYRDEDSHTVANLEYDLIREQFLKMWKEAKNDKEIKLRCGYQLVRLAHYSRHYEDAIAYFEEYVESLNYKPAMYYHALAQKAGAKRGLELIIEANSDFAKVFSNSKNLKRMAVQSIRLSENKGLAEFLATAKTEDEINDIYLLLGYLQFSNPLNSAKKILEKSPDAIQAKVLMARAINTLERNVLSINEYWQYNGEKTSNDSIIDSRYPFINSKIRGIFDETMEVSIEMADSKRVKDKHFWNLTTSYLHFLNKDFSAAKKYLAKIENIDTIYMSQKRQLAMYIDISEHKVITPTLEEHFYHQYGDLLKKDINYWEREEDYTSFSTYAFVKDVLANKYFIQKDYAKSFLMNNSVHTIENNLNLDLITSIQNFYNKSNKNKLEQLVAQNALPKDEKLKTIETFDVNSYLEHVRGVALLAQGNLVDALIAFKKSSNTDYMEAGKSMFGYSTNHFISDAKIVDVYQEEFEVIKSKMTTVELVEALIRLEHIGRGSDELAAKANYLIGNFFYNTSNTGPFRGYLRFKDGSNYKYSYFKEKDIYSDIYFKYYDMYYKNTANVANKYLEQAYSFALSDELKAKIAFALSKCEQDFYYETSDISYYSKNGVMIKNRNYFKELSKYKNTQTFKEVSSNCKYFDYYVSHFAK